MKIHLLSDNEIACGLPDDAADLQRSTRPDRVTCERCRRILAHPIHLLAGAGRGAARGLDDGARRRCGSDVGRVTRRRERCTCRECLAIPHPGGPGRGKRARMR